MNAPVVPDLAPEMAVITCPLCRHASEAQIPVDACVFFYDCEGCGTVLRPKPGDCCVFCSYGTVRCPSAATGAGRCGAS